MGTILLGLPPWLGDPGMLLSEARTRFARLAPGQCFGGIGFPVR
jgi:hypothetical protein